MIERRKEREAPHDRTNNGSLRKSTIHIPELGQQSADRQAGRYRATRNEANKKTVTTSGKYGWMGRAKERVMKRRE